MARRCSSRAWKRACTRTARGNSCASGTGIRPIGDSTSPARRRFCACVSRLTESSRMTMTLFRTSALLALAVVAACARQEEPKHFVKTATGISVTPAQGPAKIVRLEVVSPRIIRVTAFPTESTDLPPSLMAVKHADGTVPFDVTADPVIGVTLKTSEITAEVNYATGQVHFKGKNG